MVTIIITMIIIIIIPFAHIQSTQSELTFWAGSNPAYSVPKIGDGKNL